MYLQWITKLLKSLDRSKYKLWVNLCIRMELSSEQPYQLSDKVGRGNKLGKLIVMPIAKFPSETLTLSR